MPETVERFLNRELSWLEFNQRVLDEALNPENPALERVKFFCIVSSNLDEFFEVRVAGIKQQMESEAVERSMDGLTPTETFRVIGHRVKLQERHDLRNATPRGPRTEAENQPPTGKEAEG